MEIIINIKSKNINKISIDDTVLCYDEQNSRYGVKKVSQTFTPIIPENDQSSLLLDESIEICTSKIHPFYDTNNNDWVNAGAIDGQIDGLGYNLQKCVISKTDLVPSEENFYDFTVDDYHNYFVGKNGKYVLTHNSATIHFPVFHTEIEDILVLKNNKGTEDNRVRKLDYSIQLSKIFYERFLKGSHITLFSPHDVPGLYEAFGTPEFDSLYVKYENDKSVPKKTVAAQDLFSSLLKERAETGRIYIMNIDHCNTHSSFDETIYMSNLCQEITLPARPINHIDQNDGQGYIATCILSAINVGQIRSLEEMETLCDLTVRGLESIIDHQNYPLPAAESYTKDYRSLGVGFIGLAHYLAKNKVKYTDPAALQLVHELTEAFQYYLLKASCSLAKEKGPAKKYPLTKYARGLLPIDHYKKEIDELVSPTYRMDWENLRKDIAEHGLRHCTLSAQMPSESCLSWETKVNTEKGLMNFHDICDHGNIDWKNIEQNDATGWYELSKPLNVLTTDGYRETSKIYFNGNTTTVRLTMEDGNVIHGTPNHKFLVSQDGKKMWKRIYDLNEDDDILQIK